jgi:protein SCO1/2
MFFTAFADKPEHPHSRLAAIRRAPDFELTTHDGKTQRLESLRGKVLLVGFIFTTCNGTCPATTHRMSEVLHQLETRGLTRDRSVRLLSITLDPVRDTQEVLSGYMQLYGIDSPNWTFLTGDPQTVARTISAWKMWVKPAANGQLDHPSRIFLVDRKGMIREIYNLGFLKPAWVAQDVELLLTEK